MLADLPIKLDPAALADLELKRGIDLFAGKSEITEGCSDFREIGDSSDLPGISDLRLSKSYGSDATGAAGTSVAAVDGRHFDAAMWRTAGAAELLWRSVALALLTGIRSTSRATPCRPVLRPGPAIDRHESRRRRWPRRFSGRKFRRPSVFGGSRRKPGALPLMAVGRWRPKAGDWGAERAHLARAVQGPTDSTCRPAARIAGSPNFGLLTEETAGRKPADRHAAFGGAPAASAN